MTPRCLRPTTPSLLALLLLLPGLGGCSQAASEATPVSKQERRAHDSDAFFAGPVQTFDIRLPRAAYQSLQSDPRKAVAATVLVGTNRFESVAVHIKGAAGSTRSIDDNPALTLNFDKLAPGQRIQGLDKLHLNNSVQDPSRMSELMCADLYRAAGVPAARTTHALVKLNGRDLGLYVLKEGFNKTFLARHFTNQNGNLYDGGFLRDIDQDLERDSGEGPDTHQDLRALHRACEIPDLSQRRDALAKLLDLDRFAAYTALQVLTDDWDGYPCNRNNYRLYHDVDTGRFVFFPHGMDQMFDRGGMPLDRGFEGIVADRAFRVPEFRNLYWNKLGQLLTQVFTRERIQATFDAAVARRRPALATRPRDEQRWIEDATAELRERMLERVGNAQRQLANRPKPAVFSPQGETRLTNWEPRTEGEGVETALVEKDGRKALQVRGRGTGAASWRTRVRLPAGRYRLEGQARVEKVVSGENQRGRGLGLRLSGVNRQNQLVGTTEWQAVTFDFTLPEEGEVEAVADFRASTGTGWFDPATLVIRRLP
jgi:spore coat protein H